MGTIIAVVAASAACGFCTALGVTAVVERRGDATLQFSLAALNLMLVALNAYRLLEKFSA